MRIRVIFQNDNRYAIDSMVVDVPPGITPRTAAYTAAEENHPMGFGAAGLYRWEEISDLDGLPAPDGWRIALQGQQLYLAQARAS